MAGMWRKIKKSFSLKLSGYLHSSKTNSTTPYSTSSNGEAHKPGSSSLAASSRSPSSSSRLLSRSFSRSISRSSSQVQSKTCAICLGNLKSGQGQAIFTAECSHSFHFGCITNNVKHGNYICPICRSKWKDVPIQFASNNRTVDQNVAGRLRVSPYQGFQEPLHFYDDEPVVTNTTGASLPALHGCSQGVSVKTFMEVPAIAASDSVSSFAVLVGVHAPPLLDDACHLERAPIDLVIVLDVSGSMAGSKLALLKRAACFLIENLAASDRLSIVAFSSEARRVLPLRRMTGRGREDALLAINSLSSNGGTNIVEGLKKGVRVLEERCEKNQIASIILLSDGKDTFNGSNGQRHMSSQNHTSSKSMQVLEYMNLLSICPPNSDSSDESRGQTLPVHTFGFGSDNDSAAMHAIANASGGTFSFIESADIIQDAFARCIGGLLSVVAQELQLTMKSLSPGVDIGSIPSGKYVSEISEQGQQGIINVGDLYADEEKEFLVYLSIPVFSPAEGEESLEKTLLLEVACSYIDSVSKEMVHLEGKRVEIRRPKILSPTDLIVSLEVDRQRNRLWVAEGIAEAQRMAETGNLEGARGILTSRKAMLLSSPSAQAGDGLCNWLEIELSEIMERIASLESYETIGRAYMLSGLSSHSWQRATTRGDSTTQTAILLSGEGLRSTNTSAMGYNTPHMVSMVSKSQNLSCATPL